MRKPQRKIRNNSLSSRTRRKLSIRKEIVGTSERPRVCITKSNKNLYVQVIDDSKGHTIVSAQTFGKTVEKDMISNVESAKKLGKTLAEKMLEKKLSVAVFDRSGHKYTGVVSAVADSMRENGIRI